MFEAAEDLLTFATGVRVIMPDTVAARVANGFIHTHVRTHVIDNYRSGVIKRSQGDSVEKLLG